MAPSRRFRRSALAARIALGYLAFVAAVAAYVGYDITVVDHADASLSGVLLIVATLPASLPLLLAADGVGAPGAPLTGFLVTAASGGLNAAGLWFALRGQRLPEGHVH